MFWAMGHLNENTVQKSRPACTKSSLQKGLAAASVRPVLPLLTTRALSQRNPSSDGCFSSSLKSECCLTQTDGQKVTWYKFL